MKAGQTFENDLWRVHRYNDSIEIKNMTFAGQRGKVVPVWHLSFSEYRGKAPFETIVSVLAHMAREKVSDARMRSFLDRLVRTYDGPLSISESETKAIRVTRHTDLIQIEGSYVTFESSPNDFTLRCRVDVDNEPVLCPAEDGGKEDTLKVYEWSKPRMYAIRGMKYSEIVRELSGLGVRFRTYCAID